MSEDKTIASPEGSRGIDPDHPDRGMKRTDPGEDGSLVDQRSREQPCLIVKQKTPAAPKKRSRKKTVKVQKAIVPVSTAGPVQLVLAGAFALGILTAGAGLFVASVRGSPQLQGAAIDCFKSVLPLAVTNILAFFTGRASARNGLRT